MSFAGWRANKNALVQKKVKEFFTGTCKGVNPDEAVAIGAALQAGLLQVK